MQYWWCNGGHRNTRRKTFSSVKFSTTNLTTVLRSNPDLRGERPTTYRLSHDTAFKDGGKGKGKGIPLQAQCGPEGG